MDNELILKVENVYKKYRLGTIGGGTLTGDLQSWWAKIRHKEELVDGEYAIGVQVAIINSKKQILISQRAPDKKILPLKWECNGGAVLSGEDFVGALIREIQEELGIKLEREEIIFHKSVKRERSFKEMYVVRKDIKIEDLRFADGEAVAGAGVDIDEFERMFNLGEIVHNVNFDRNDYEKCVEILEEREVVKGE